jgi:transposase, IS5 family
MEDSPMKTLLLEFEKVKASIRAKVEHPFHVIKNLFGYRKVRYKGLAETRRSCSPCLLSAIWRCRDVTWAMRAGSVCLESGPAAG